MSSNNMRGLTVFIADIRNCRVRELEERRINKEMANIRAKFKDANLNGYQKKKYVCKLLYMYILGWDVDFGHLEAVSLISSSKFSEKQIGYLAVTLLMHENSDLVRLVINSIKKDLYSHHEIHNCLALHAIANIGGREMAESLSEDVYRLLISPTSKSFVKKKAALTLLRLYRKYADVVPVKEWAERIISIMDDVDLGVCLCVTTCILTMAQEHPHEFTVVYTKVVDRLNRIVCDGEFVADYVYYKVPVPWLQVKLLRLLQYYPPSEDATTRAVLHNVLQTIIYNSQETPKNIQHNNAQNAVLFEAINLAIHLDTESQVVDQAAALLGRFISSKETNVRYLGLETMAHLAGTTDTLEPIQKHQETILFSLRDKDISVRRRALDLLYSMCDMNNSKTIVEELLRYLHSADYALREEMVLKIAILTEKFATEYQWYIDIILQLISMAGDHVADEVWHRLIQIVTNNNEQLQEYAAKKALEHLQAPTCHENLVKVGSYLLGEFGHLIANYPNCTPIEQFHAIHSKFSLSSPATRAMLLSTYIKFVNLFPEIRNEVLMVFQQYSQVLDPELQQRACEYLTIATMPSEDLLITVCEEMPPFPERKSALISRLVAKHADTEDKRTWIIGGKEANRERQLLKQKSIDAKKQNPMNVYVTDTNGNGNALEDLAGLDTNSRNVSSMQTDDGDSVNNEEENGLSNSNSTSTIIIKPEVINAKEAIEPSKILTHGWEKWWNKLTYNAEGILYEDAQLQIGVKSEYHGNLGRMAIYFGNKISTSITSFTTSIDSPKHLSIKSPQIPAHSIGPITQVKQLFHMECLDIFSEEPTIKINYLAGSLQTINLKLPIVLTKFIEPIELNKTDFFSRWKQIGGPPRESQRIAQAKHSMPQRDMENFIRGFKFEILKNVDPTPSNLVGAGVLHTTEVGKIGCLLRLEPNQEAKVFRLTIRATKENVADAIMKHMQPILIQGLEPLARDYAD